MKATRIMAVAVLIARRIPVAVDGTGEAHLLQQTRQGAEAQ